MRLTQCSLKRPLRDASHVVVWRSALEAGVTIPRTGLHRTDEIPRSDFVSQKPLKPTMGEAATLFFALHPPWRCVQGKGPSTRSGHRARDPRAFRRKVLLTWLHLIESEPVI